MFIVLNFSKEKPNIGNSRQGSKNLQRKKSEGRANGKAVARL